MKMNFSKDDWLWSISTPPVRRRTPLRTERNRAVIHDRQTREIVESTIRKLDAIPSRSAAALSLIRSSTYQERDNSIRRRLAEAKAQTRTQKPQSKRKQPDRERHNRFQSRRPWTAPLEEAQLYTTLEVVRCVLPEAPCREQMISTDFQSAPIITGEATLPLRWLPPATP
jgi:hypothetical protein